MYQNMRGVYSPSWACFLIIYDLPASFARRIVGTSISTALNKYVKVEECRTYSESLADLSVLLLRPRLDLLAVVLSILEVEAPRFADGK